MNYELQIKEARIYNVLGVLVYQAFPDNNKSSINITQLNKGIYFIETKDSDGKITTSKFIKE